MDKFFAGLKSCIKTIKGAVSDWHKKQEINWAQEQLAIRQYQKQLHINTIASQIQTELFDLIQISPYQFTKSVAIPTDILYMGYAPVQNTIIYSYRINVVNMPNQVVLRQFLNDIKRDTYTFQQQITAQLGFQNALLLYPCLMNGMYIMNVKPIGCMIQLDIVTNWTP